jgi:hypothetical protein
VLWRIRRSPHPWFVKPTYAGSTQRKLPLPFSAGRYPPWTPPFELSARPEPLPTCSLLPTGFLHCKIDSPRQPASSKTAASYPARFMRTIAPISARYPSNFAERARFFYRNTPGFNPNFPFPTGQQFQTPSLVTTLSPANQSAHEHKKSRPDFSGLAVAFAKMLNLRR